jgi:riboflavin kinase/FMN adenylyltransferase
MKVFRGLPPPAERVPCALAIGNFDGVHRGHQALLAQVIDAARTRDVVPAVMTFEPHPRELFAPEKAPARIANVRDKLDALRAHGVERVYLMHFNRRFASITAEAFVDDIVVEALHTHWLMVGDDFRFGARRAGDFALLQRAAQQHGFELKRLPAFEIDGARVSSSAVRAALASGDLRRAERLLGHRYAISGRVLHGRKLGRGLGFPTLNLRISHRRRMTQPAVHGIFAVRVHGLEPAPLAGVASVGLRPTVDDSGLWLLEVHVFDFAREVYGARVRVEFIERLRDEQRYASMTELAAAIRADAARARALLDGDADKLSSDKLWSDKLA